MEDEDKSVHTIKDVDEEDIDVDITTVRPIQAFLSRFVCKRIGKEIDLISLI